MAFERLDAVRCATCFTPNPDRADFCHACGRPLSPVATLDPLKAIEAQGLLSRRVASGGVPGWVLGALWPLALPGLASPLWLGMARGPALEGAWPVAAVTWALGWVVLLRGTAAFVRRRGAAPGR